MDTTTMLPPLLHGLHLLRPLPPQPLRWNHQPLNSTRACVESHTSKVCPCRYDANLWKLLSGSTCFQVGRSGKWITDCSSCTRLLRNPPIQYCTLGHFLLPIS